MKKFTIFLVVGALFATNIYMKYHNLSIPKPIPTEQVQLRDFTKEQNRIAELNKMQDPTIIQNEIRKVGEITSLKGKYKYLSKISNKDKFFDKFTLREITLDFEYNYGIGINSLEYLKVSKIENGIIYINIPKNRIQLIYIEQNMQNSKITDDNTMFLFDQFSPSDTQILSAQAQQNVVNAIGKDKKLFDDAMINLQENIEGLVLGLGYEQVVFNVV